MVSLLFNSQTLTNKRVCERLQSVAGLAALLSLHGPTVRRVELQLFVQAVD